MKIHARREITVQVNNQRWLCNCNMSHHFESAKVDGGDKSSTVSVHVNAGFNLTTNPTRNMETSHNTWSPHTIKRLSLSALKSTDKRLSSSIAFENIQKQRDNIQEHTLRTHACIKQRYVVMKTLTTASIIPKPPHSCRNFNPPLTCWLINIDVPRNRWSIRKCGTRNLSSIISIIT